MIIGNLKHYEGYGGHSLLVVNATAIYQQVSVVTPNYLTLHNSDVAAQVRHTSWPPLLPLKLLVANHVDVDEDLNAAKEECLDVVVLERVSFWEAK